MTQFDPKKCALCRSEWSEQSGISTEFASRYPGLVCRACDESAVTARGGVPEHDSSSDSGDETVFIDGVRCHRRLRFGGYVTMVESVLRQVFPEASP
jgi:hypothetical protein